MKGAARLIARLVWRQIVFALPLLLVRAALEWAGLTSAPHAADDIRIASIGGGVVHRSSAASLSGGAVCWIMGGVVLDLRGARLSEAGADLRVVTVMGGTSVLIPPEWPVELQARSIMGGAQPPRDPGTGGPTLRIRALTIMGGLDVSRRLAPDRDGASQSADASL